MSKHLFGLRAKQDAGKVSPAFGTYHHDMDLLYFKLREISILLQAIFKYRKPAPGGRKARPYEIRL